MKVRNLFKRKKLRIGIDINEILRARWAQFDKYYFDEFGEEGIPKGDAYCYDLFKNYKWDDVEEKTTELKEPDDIPDTINPVDYQTDENGESAADFMLFKKTETKTIKSKDVYNRFMYEDFVLEIHGNAPLMHRNTAVDLKTFFLKYKDTVDFTITSVENFLSIPSTLFFLSKMTSRFTNYSFVDKPADKWKGVDILITTDPEVLESAVPWGKFLIKVKRPYNENLKSYSLEITKIKELFDNKIFEKIIKFKKTKK